MLSWLGIGMRDHLVLGDADNIGIKCMTLETNHLFLALLQKTLCNYILIILL